jgi:hypothetical protein
MSFNGSGTFLINSSGQPVVTGTVISSTTFNALTADLANGLSNCITRDGQTSVSANIPMNNFKITGLGEGTNNTDASTIGQVQSTVAKLIGSISGTNTITGTLTPAITTYTAGQMFYFVAVGANTGAVTLNINGLGAKAITSNGANALSAGDISSGEIIVVVYDGTQFQIISNLNTTVAAAGSNTQLQYNNSGVLGGSTLTYNNSTGGFSIAAPSSGTTLALVSAAGATVPQTMSNGTITAQLDFGSSQFNIGTSTAHGIALVTNGTRNVQISSGGNVTINAPSSGIAFDVTAVSGAAVAVLRGITSNSYIQFNRSGSANGYIGSGDSVVSGGSSADFGVVAAASGGLNFGTNGSTSRMTIASGGNVTINAPTSGAALTVTAATGGTTNAGLTVNGSSATPPSAVTFSATAMTVDCTKSNAFTTTFTANVTTAPTISNPQDGQTIRWFITQDGTGSRTMTWPTSFKWPGGSAGVLSTAANSVDMVTATYRSSTGFWYTTLQKAFA